MLARLTLNKWSITLFNILTGLVLYLAVEDVAWNMWAGRWEKMEGLEEAVTGIGAILIAYGVVLEERFNLRRLMGGDMTRNVAYEETVDHHCHELGLLLLVFGLFAEIAVEAIKVPQRVIPTKGIEHFVMAGGTFFLALSVAVLAVYTLRIVMSTLKNSHGHGEATATVPAAEAEKAAHGH